MAAARIETPREFFDHVVDVDVSDFLKNSTDLRVAYHACNSLLSLRDWIVTKCGKKGWSWEKVAQQPFEGALQLQKALEAIDQRFAIVPDIANASKRVVLDRSRSRTNLYGNVNTEINPVHRGILAGGPLGAAPLAGSSPRIVVKIDTTNHDVRDCVGAAHAIWRNLLAENSW
jgi:hypothetical protein